MRFLYSTLSTMVAWSSVAAACVPESLSVAVVPMEGFAVFTVWPSSERSLCSATVLPDFSFARVSKHTRSAPSSSLLASKAASTSTVPRASSAVNLLVAFTGSPEASSTADPSALFTSSMVST